MAELSYPFDSADVNEAEWSKMAKFWLPSGVIRAELNGLECFADATGMQVKVRTGRGFVEGHYYENDAEKTLTISAANPTNPRIDRVVLRKDATGNQVILAVLTGTPAGSPSAPALTQTTTTWEVPVAQVSVPAGDTGIDAAQVTDERQWTSPHSEQIVSFSAPDILAVTTGKGFLKMPWPGLFLGFWPYVNTAPTGASLIVDVMKNGTSLWATTPGNRPTIAASSNTTTDEVTNMDTKTFAKGDRVSLDIDQVGSTVAGADLVVAMRVVRTG